MRSGRRISAIFGRMKAGCIWPSCSTSLTGRSWVGRSMTADIVADALTMANGRRKPAPGLMHHSDRGSQYASRAFQDQLTGYGMICSMSRKTNCWDNAPTESFFNSLKNERVHGSRYTTRQAADADVFEYIEVFYNRKRRHSTLGYTSPIQFMEHWMRGQDGEKRVA